MLDNKKSISLTESFKIFSKAFVISLKNKSAFSIIINLLGIGAAFLPVLISRALQHLTDEIQLLFSISNGQADNAIRLFAILAALFIIQTVYQFLQSYTLAIDGIRTTKYIRRKILEHTCNVKYKYIENYDNFKECIVFAETHAGRRVADSMQSIIVWLQYVISFISILIVLLEVNVWIAVMLIATSVPAAILSYKQKDESYIFNTKWIKEGAMVIHYFFICAGKDAINEVRHLKLFEYLKARWRNIADDYLGKKNKMTKKHVLYNSISDILRNAVYIGVLLLVVNDIFTNPSIGLGVFMLVLNLSRKFQNITAKLLMGAANFFNDIHYMKDFFDLDSIEHEKIDPLASSYENTDIQYKDVSFKYQNNEAFALKNINITIKDKEKVAIVGENGSGKTTFVNLLCGMHESLNGSITINGTDIHENISKVRKSISVVFQDFGKYDATLRENISVSDSNSTITDDEIMEFAKQLHAEDIILKQPNGLDEELGIFSKNENLLSGGQWQKIALLRALYRRDAKIMILDEPTAALDPISEAKLYHGFADITKGKTTILISHRLGITSIVDRILVFKDGEIIEDGHHLDLMKNKGYYSKMYRAQAKWYDEEI